MTYTFSDLSKSRMAGIHPDLKRVLELAMSKQLMDFSIAEGVRGINVQKELVKKGLSKTMESKHLIQKDGYGHAVDLYPHPIDMVKVRAGDAREISRFGYLAGVIMMAGKELGISITWGGDWDNDGEVLDHTFFDAPHFQLSNGDKK